MFTSKNTQPFSKWIKLLFTLTLLLCSTIGFGQVQSHTATVVTHYLTVEDMMWSDIKEENIFLEEGLLHSGMASIVRMTGVK